MHHAADFLTGVIEGFYGRSWPLETRLHYADYLAEAGLNTCIYCPKGDAFLRGRWREDWPEQDWNDLHHLSQAYGRRGISWGVGLSPVALYLSYGVAEREALHEKVKRLAELGAPLLAILFDDMPGELDELAQRQAEIVSDVCDWVPQTRVLACPTYYSYDPVLEQYFGDMPEGYWQDLGRQLPGQVDIFWTGPRVCSDAIDSAHLESITAQLGRSVILWDNYPVNDGGTRCEFLYTEKLANRQPGIESYLTGHLCNPMNQGMMSLPALAGLSELYGKRGLDDRALAGMLGTGTWEMLQRDAHLFQYEGLSGMGSQRRIQLAAEYERLPGSAAREIAGWLKGEYAFDPACLTG